MTGNLRSEEHRIVLNTMFSYFRTNFIHAREHFNDKEDRATLKKIWYRSLIQFPPVTIQQACQKIIENEKYFPTIKIIRDYCFSAFYQTLGVPEVEKAYEEALYSSSPRLESQWSHPIVYIVANECGWEYLLDTSKSVAMRKFEKIYNKYKLKLLGGQTFIINAKSGSIEIKPNPQKLN